MRAAFIKSPFQIDVREIDPPEPGPYDALLAVAMVGICGSDVHLANAWAPEWRRFGHETTARVVEVGEKIHDLAPGDLVAVRTTSMCGVCRFCMDGQPRACLDWRKTRMSLGLADYIAAPRRSIWKVESLDVLAATLIEPLAVSIDVVNTADVGLDHDVAIVGPGPIGMMAIKLCKLRGARRVIVFGTADDTSRFPLCEELGADACFTVADEGAANAVIGETMGVGLDRAIVTAPPVAVPFALRLVRYGGIVTFVGFSAESDGAIVDIDLNAFHNSKLQLRASYAAPLAPFAQANRILTAGHLPVSRMITHHFRLEELEPALRLVANHEEGVVKAVVDVS